VDLLRGLDGDLTITDHTATLVSGAAETAQRLRAKFQLYRGEWFISPAEGTPYREVFWPKDVTHTVKVGVLRRMLLSDPDVATVQTLEFTVDALTREGTITFEVLTKSGQVLRSADFGPYVIEGMA